ncbi:AraC family transcriptional regulator ligand-binding domain-containing protein [Parahaliea sp. F7430]|uniref:AraC family transcriptional regulator ligand-binding domain-containing protein n=1 Tax=Sediminihaliea albiluteola TaxID=2758564 RepID=A0A7W2YJX1_9GAMM|nr:AraC family transcriptional regulator [Sediminihaliea albiluteola]MBA6414021.1 AraC family transcriptional regulator ligand-binding domain-containing protein [Sediminihaliea albiluteola]
MAIPTVSPSFMHAVFEYLASQGIDESTVLKQLKRRDKRQLVVNGRVALQDYQNLFAVGEALTEDNYFGLHMGASPMPRTWGLVSHLVMAAPNPLLAITALMNYSRLQLDFAQFDLSEPEGDELVLSWHSNAARRPSRHVIEHVFANIMALANTQAGYPSQRVSIEFKHDYVGDAGHVEKVLNASVSFGCSGDRIFVPKQFLQLQSQYAQDDLFSFGEELARQRLLELRGADKLINSVRESILNQLPFGLPKVAATAKTLDMTARTLQRRLQERHLSYKALLDEVRRELARELVQKPELSLSDVADYLGFNDQSAFQHAFQRWENTTPGKFRKSLAGKLKL